MVIASRSKDKLEAVARKAHALAPSTITIGVCTADFGEESSAEKVVNHAVAALGGLDTVILNHVTTVPHTWGTWSGPEGLAAADGGKAGAQILRSLFAINTFSFFLIATAALPHLEAAKGSLVVVSSAAGKLGLPKVCAYSATKHALHGFFDSLRHELALRRKEVRSRSLPFGALEIAGRPHAHPPQVAVTTCVLGSIDTQTNADGTGGDLNPSLGKSPADECARAIMRAGADRRREACYPAAQIVPMLLLRPWIPDTLDAIIRRITLSEQGRRPPP
jgi:NAD(P)-dependent dehydrogenase (short-subunit alcohol dehydrogenase family)